MELLRDVAGGVRLNYFGEEASTAEIDLAKDLLTATIKGLAYALIE